MDQKLYTNHLEILKDELIMALGCTEPIAIAYAAAKARKLLGQMPEKCVVSCSGNIVKNVMGVTVPNSGGLKESMWQQYWESWAEIQIWIWQCLRV